MFSIVCVASCKAVAFMLTALSKGAAKKRHTKNQNQYTRDTQVHRVAFIVRTYEIHLIEIGKREKKEPMHTYTWPQCLPIVKAIAELFFFVH